MAEKKTIKGQLKGMLPQFMKDHPTYFYQGFLVALSGGFEQLWEEIGFKCPSSLDSPYNDLDTYHKYSALNVAGPAAALWIICLFGSNMAMRSCQGYCCQLRDVDWGNCCYAFWSVFFRTLVIPLAWVFVALIDGDFLACYNYLPNCNTDSNMIFIDGINCTTNITMWNHANKIQSQVYGWYLLMACLGILLVLFFGRCCSKRTYFPNLYSNTLRKLERVEMEKLLEEEAKKKAATNAGDVMMMMTMDDINPQDWEAVTMEHPNVTVPYNANKRKREYYKHPSSFSEWKADNSERVEKKKEEKAEAEKAEKEKAEAENAEKAKAEAEKAKVEAEKAKAVAEKAKAEAETAKAEAEKAKAKAEKAEAEKANNNSGN